MGIDSSSATALLDSVSESSDLELTIMQMRLDSAAALDPRLPRAVRVSAVSKDVEAELLSVLLDETDADAAQGLLEAMAGQGFVSESGGVYRFHDVVREALLREWHISPERELELGGLNQRLVDHFNARLAEAMALDKDFAQISFSVREANPGRWARLKATLDGRISWAVRRAARHGFAIGPLDGMTVLRSNLDQLITDDRLTVADRLLTEAREHLNALPDSEEIAIQRAVIRYFFAALKRRVSGAAASELAAVAEDPRLPDEYRLWALDDLAIAYESDERLTDAARVRVELAQQPAELDAYNAPLWAFNLGWLRWRLLEREAAIEAMQRSLALTTLDGARTDLVVRALCALSELSDDVGRPDDSLAAAVAAVDQVLTGPGLVEDDPPLAMRTLSNLLAGLDLRGSEAAWAASSGFVHDRALTRADVLAERAEFLGAAGATAGSRQASLESLALAAAIARFESPAGDLSLRRGFAAELEGDYAAARQHFDEALAAIDSPAISIRGLDALTGRARARRRCGDLDGATDDLERAGSRFREMGWGRRDAVLDIERAEVALARGQLEACTGHLAAADAGLEGADTWDRTHRFTVLAALHLARSDWERADAAHQEALLRHDQRGDLVSTVAVLTGLARSAEERADWHRHQLLTRRLARRLQLLAARSDAVPSSAALEAASAGAEAMALWISPGRGEEGTALVQSRTSLERARRLDPRCFWYPFSLSYQLAADQHWGEARRMLDKALSLAPPALRTVPKLHERVLEYAQAEAVLAGSTRAVGGLDAVTAKYLQVVDEHLPKVDAPMRRPYAATGVVLAALIERPTAVLTMASAMGRGWSAATTGTQAAIAAARGLIRGPQKYWRVVDLLRQLAQESSGAARNLDVVVHGLEVWLNEQYGLNRDTSEPPHPPTTAILLEVGSDIVRFVNDQLDDGRFLFELVPALRRRLAAEAGIEIPTLRSREEPSLAPSGVRIQLGQAPVLVTSLDAGQGALVEPYDPARHRGEQVLPSHPADGRPGPWALIIDRTEWSSPAGDPAGPEQADGDHLTPELALVALLELAVRRQPQLFLSPEDTEDRLTRWRTDPSLAERISPNALGEDAGLTLTWALRALATERVPLLDADVLDGLATAGGLTAGRDEIVEAVRHVVGDRLPGLEPSRRVCALPNGLARTALDPGDEVDRASAAARLTDWLQSTVRERGVWLTVIVPDEVDRPRIDALLRRDQPLVAVVSAAEWRQR